MINFIQLQDDSFYSNLVEYINKVQQHYAGHPQVFPMTHQLAKQIQEESIRRKRSN
ncbi:hypothetical protein [Spirosoma gilvum]